MPVYPDRRVLLGRERVRPAAGPVESPPLATQWNELVHLHIIGICGTFMGGVARLALEAGHRVTGCDAAVYPPMSDQLRAAGIELLEGFGADQVALRPDLYLVGNVVARGNPLFEAVLASGARFTSGPAWVGEHVLHGRHVVAVAGTHGKTTTSAMLAWILEQAGLDPGFLIGGVPGDFGVSARTGSGRCFVIEADEYDSALFDKRSKFVHYFPSTLVLNNLEFDHADIFADLAAIETQFHHLLRCVPQNGRLIVNGRDAALARVLARGLWSELERFDVEDEWHWRDLADGADHFAVLRGGQMLGTLAQGPAGDHNRSNAVAAIAAAAHAGVDVSRSLAALGSFSGVRRRLELRGTVRRVSVYDDFAHHPTAIATTLAGLRRRVGAERILALLEPRSNTMRLGVMQEKLAASLAGADLVFCYGPREGKHALGWDPTEALRPLGARARVFERIDDLVAAVADGVRPRDHVLAMSNGGFGGVHEKILAALQALPADFGPEP
jgi:UDP-N-acetylmuramate: L-alanyl-gamma-D-glutamyl-meso-diaminopimelate ligase